jgi:hypothetical protein
VPEMTAWLRCDVRQGKVVIAGGPTLDYGAYRRVPSTIPPRQSRRLGSTPDSSGVLPIGSLTTSGNISWAI